MARRKNLHVKLTDESYEAWHGFAAANGVSVTAIVEAMGERFAAVNNGTQLAPAGAEMVTRAREIDEARRRRQR
jgi:hypothetical protein